MCGTSGLGRQVHVFALPTPHMHEMEEITEYDQDLCALFPHLTSLRHFIGCRNRMIGRISISAQAFTLLAQAAGDNILTISGLYLRKDDHLSPAVFNSLKSLNKLNLTSPPSILEGQTNFHPESLSGLRELSLCQVSNFPKIFSVLRHVQGSAVLVEYEFNHSIHQRLPNLTSVTITATYSPILEDFVEAYGLSLEQIEFSGSAALEHVFLHAPKLRELRWQPHSYPLKDSELLATTFSRCDRHSKLQKIILIGIRESGEYYIQITLVIGRPYTPTGTSEKEHINITNAVFLNIKFSKFPCLKEIQFQAYAWPTEE